MPLPLPAPPPPTPACSPGFSGAVIPGTLCHSSRTWKHSKQRLPDFGALPEDEPAAMVAAAASAAVAPCTGSKFDGSRDTLTFGPLDTSPTFTGVDPAMVYARLSNFMARRQGLSRAASENTEVFPSGHATPRSALASPAGSIASVHPPPTSPSPQSLSGEFRRERSMTSGGLQPAILRARDDFHAGDEIACIQRHLEEMNMAAAELNVAQQDLVACTKRRHSLTQLWAVGSARLARDVGAHRLARATAFYECQRRCKAARLQIDTMSQQFISAIDAARPSNEVQQLSRQHARSLSEFQRAQSELKRACGSQRAKPSMLAAVAPYFEAEDEHTEQLRDADAAVALLDLKAKEAKARYHTALRSLEQLSERAHQKRSASDAPVGTLIDQSSRTPSKSSQLPASTTSPTAVLPVPRRAASTTAMARNACRPA